MSYVNKKKLYVPVFVKGDRNNTISNNSKNGHYEIREIIIDDDNNYYVSEYISELSEFSLTELKQKIKLISRSIEKCNPVPLSKLINKEVSLDMIDSSIEESSFGTIHYGYDEDDYEDKSGGDYVKELDFE